MNAPTYGARGSVGVLVPQPNPAAEVELALLIGANRTTVVGRMACDAPDMLTRLRAYADEIDTTIAGTFAGIALDAIAFACTGSSYVLSDARIDFEARDVASGAPPFFSAAGALCAALAELDTREIALVSPYPDDLTAAAVRFWQRSGFTILDLVRCSMSGGGHPIYGLTAQDVWQAGKKVTPDAKTIVVMGTGVPTLPVIHLARDRGGPTVISSNFCLGWQVARHLDSGALPLRDFLGDDAGWRARLLAQYPLAAALVP